MCQAARSETISSSSRTNSKNPSEFETLVQQGKINNLESNQSQAITSEGWSRFYSASPEDQAEALRRYEVIKPYLEGRKPEYEVISPRTIRYWKAKYLAAQQKDGCGYLGLLSLDALNLHFYIHKRLMNIDRSRKL